MHQSPAKRHVVELEKIPDEFYALRGGGENAVSMGEKLRAPGLSG